MNELLTLIVSWIEERSQRQRAMLLAGTLFVFYVLFYATWVPSLNDQTDILAQQIEPLQATLDQLSTQKEKIIIDSKQPPTEQQYQERDALKQKSQQLSNTLSQHAALIITPTQMLDVLKSVLAQAHLSLNQLENKAPVPVIPITSNSTQQPALFTHTFILQFHGDFYSTLAYLQKLEKLPWRIYWDDFTYQVDKYPTAKVTVILHLLSTQENLINV